MKKKHILILILTLYFHIGHAQITARIDERFELTSITFALAGVPEFCESRIPSYLQDIITYFTPYEFSESINFVRKLNQEHHIGYNAVSNVTAYLEIKKDTIILKHETLDLNELDPRWNKNLLIEYITMLNLFYKESNFNLFFENHKELYSIAEQRMSEYFSQVNLNKWLYSFFGKELDQNIKIYLSLVNGRHNYAFPGGIIIGVPGDQNGMPTPNSLSLPIYIHEIFHHYTNTVFPIFWSKLEEASNKIYPHARNQMSIIGYNNAKTMTLEWLNNLFVLMYLKSINHSIADYVLTQNMQNGFIWMERSIEFMDNFSSNRECYESIDSFMHQIISFYNYIANNYDLVIKEFKCLNPFITTIFPAPGSSLSGFKKIIITFSQPMNGSYGFCGIPPNCEALPVDFKNIKWSSDKRKFIMNLNYKIEKHNYKYGIKLNPSAFQSAKYYNLDNNVNCDIIYY